MPGRGLVLIRGGRVWQDRATLASSQRQSGEPVEADAPTRPVSASAPSEGRGTTLRIASEILLSGIVLAGIGWALAHLMTRMHELEQAFGALQNQVTASTGENRHAIEVARIKEEDVDRDLAKRVETLEQAKFSHRH